MIYKRKQPFRRKPRNKKWVLRPGWEFRLSENFAYAVLTGFMLLVGIAMFYVATLN